MLLDPMSFLIIMVLCLKTVCTSSLVHLADVAAEVEALAAAAVAVATDLQLHAHA